MYKYVNLIFIFFNLNLLTKSFVSTNICLNNKCSICLNIGCNCMLTYISYRMYCKMDKNKKSFNMSKLYKKIFLKIILKNYLKKYVVIY